MIDPDRSDASPSRNNPFRAYDKVRFREGIGRNHVKVFEVHHVERNMVFIFTTNGAGFTKVVDFSSSMFVKA